MGEKPRSFEIAFEGTKYVFGPLTLKDAITFCQKAIQVFFFFYLSKELSNAEGGSD